MTQIIYLGPLPTEHIVNDYIIAIYINNTHIISYIQCYVTHDLKYIADYVLLQHGYIVFKYTNTICYITHYTPIFMYQTDIPI